MEATVPQHCNCTVRFGCSGTCYTEYSVYGEYHGIQLYSVYVQYCSSTGSTTGCTEYSVQYVYAVE